MKLIESSGNLSNKIFYHGSGEREEFKIRRPSPQYPFYVTRSKQYAERYTAGVGKIFLVKLNNETNVFNPNNAADISKVKDELPRLIRFLWFGESIYGDEYRIKNKWTDLYSISSRLKPSKWVKQLDNICDIIKYETNRGIDDILPQIEQDVDEFSKWLKNNNYTEDRTYANRSNGGAYNEIRFIILNILSKHGFQAYWGKETFKNHEIYGIFDINAINGISIKPLN